jgi:hypothetical protein
MASERNDRVLSSIRLQTPQILWLIRHILDKSHEPGATAKFVLARRRIRLADFQPDWPILKFSSFSGAMAADRVSALRRNSVGVRPVSALKARLNGPIDWKPASMAIVSTATSR